MLFRYVQDQNAFVARLWFSQRRVLTYCAKVLMLIEATSATNSQRATNIGYVFFINVKSYENLCVTISYNFVLKPILLCSFFVQFCDICKSRKIPVEEPRYIHDPKCGYDVCVECAEKV